MTWVVIVVVMSAVAVTAGFVAVAIHREHIKHRKYMAKMSYMHSLHMHNECRYVARPRRYVKAYVDWQRLPYLGANRVSEYQEALDRFLRSFGR